MGRYVLIYAEYIKQLFIKWVPQRLCIKGFDDQIHPFFNFCCFFRLDQEFWRIRFSNNVICIIFNFEIKNISEQIFYLGSNENRLFDDIGSRENFRSCLKYSYLFIDDSWFYINSKNFLYYIKIKINTLKVKLSCSR